MVGDERLLFNPASVWRVVIAAPADWYMVSRGIHAAPSMRGGTGHTLPKATCKQRYCPGSPIASQGFTGAWSRRRALPSMNQNSRFPLKKAAVQYKPYCLCKQTKHSKISLSVRECKKWFKYPVPRHQPRVSLTSRPF